MLCPQCCTYVCFLCGPCHLRCALFMRLTSLRVSFRGIVVFLPSLLSRHIRGSSALILGTDHLCFGYCDEVVSSKRTALPSGRCRLPSSRTPRFTRILFLEERFVYGGGEGCLFVAILPGPSVTERICNDVAKRGVPLGLLAPLAKNHIVYGACRIDSTPPLRVSAQRSTLGPSFSDRQLRVCTIILSSPHVQLTGYVLFSTLLWCSDVPTSMWLTCGRSNRRNFWLSKIIARVPAALRDSGQLLYPIASSAVSIVAKGY